MTVRRTPLDTVVAISVTPFHPDGSIDWDAHAALIARLVAHGIGTVTVNGNTGEFYALSPAEARRAVESAVSAAGGGAHVMVGVGLDLATATSAARHAAASGASSLMVHQPVHPYRSAEGWIDYHRAIAEVAPTLGVVLYIRDERIGGAQIRALADRCPNLIGVKYAVPDPVRFASTASTASTAGGTGSDVRSDGLSWVAGLAELSAPGYWAVGATGFTSGLVNVVPKLSLALLAALRAGDRAEAMRVWESARSFEELRAADSAADNVSVVKEALAQLGLCDRAVRPPSRLLPGPLRARIAASITDWGQEGWL
ncbi:dihydrodipicolinate synthase family protein [Streptacidiphilus sp. PAMC 29251]